MVCKYGIRTNSPRCSVLLRTSFCFLQVNQQKHVGMVYTNNKLLLTDLQTFLVETIPHCVFD